MITQNLHGIHRIQADVGAASPDYSWVTLSFPGSDDRCEITLFFDDLRQAANYANAINSVPFKAPIDEQVTHLDGRPEWKGAQAQGPHPSVSA